MLEGDDYNGIIWQIFSVAIISSAVILYYFWTDNRLANLPFFRIITLYLGFAILIYSSLLIEGFGRKKQYQLENNNRYI
ncbi:MAG: hypothetical protein WD876_01455 [Candidatus Pacearchaeota archaeon]